MSMNVRYEFTVNCRSHSFASSQNILFICPLAFRRTLQGTTRWAWTCLWVLASINKALRWYNNYKKCTCTYIDSFWFSRCYLYCQNHTKMFQVIGILQSVLGWNSPLIFNCLLSQNICFVALITSWVFNCSGSGKWWETSPDTCQIQVNFGHSSYGCLPCQPIWTINIVY